MNIGVLRIRIVFLSALLLGSSCCMQAQSSARLAVGASFDYTRTNVLPGCRCVNLLGGGGEIMYALSPRIALLGNLDIVQRGNITPDDYDLKQLTWGVGLRARTGSLHRTGIFADVLAGSAHAFGTLSPAQTGFGSSNAFAFQVGGGAEVKISHRWRLEAGKVYYVLTTFANGQENRQNDLRISTGLRFLLH